MEPRFHLNSNLQLQLFQFTTTRYNYQACQYDGGTITNFPTNQYPELIEWINLSQYQRLVCN